MSKHVLTIRDFQWAQNTRRDTQYHTEREHTYGRDLAQTSVTLDISYSYECPLAREFHAVMAKLQDLNALRGTMLDPTVANNQRAWCVNEINKALNGDKVNWQDCPEADDG